MSQAVSSDDGWREVLVSLVEGHTTQLAVQRAISDVLGHDVDFGSFGFKPHRVTWKPGRRLRAFYDVAVNSGVVPVSVRWEHQASTSVVEIWPDDRAWSHVPIALGETVQRLALSSVGWNGVGDLSATVVRYRPGQRHVLRLSGADGAVAFLKVGALGSGAANVNRAQILANACTAIGVRAPTPTWWSDDLGAVAASSVEGIPLSTQHELGIFSHVGALLAALHLESVDTNELPLRTVSLESSLTLRACEHIVALHPELETQLQVIVEAAVVALKSRTVAPVLLHGDAKLDHFLVADRSIALIDLDSAAQGDPFYDLGRLIASLRWETNSQTASAARTAILEGYFEVFKGSRPDPADEFAIDGWTALWIVKQAARRIPLLDPALSKRVLDALGMARSLLASTLR